ncbi:hypothetical protein RF683_02330 [Flavobacterium sp. 20NA77.7]|uniref:Uncharacterized protein n=1 Tax=Flavobacterium nakdongensis TaxID=3073563 RepID=A0ABY9RAP2_9FLAO|nr:hypothetical protein [Flavobacterium sp. 20NA77.7]WMW78303.1 hypothetical protein RF683_02330 [Flavobacterium sp. 20NA77.7]
MKYFIIIIALSFITKPLIPLVDYVINHEYIATELCENIAKPEMHCDGKCHLKKELAKAASDEKPISNQKSSISKQEVELLFCQFVDAIYFRTLFSTLKNKISDRYQNLYFHNSIDTVFHPPTILNFLKQ